MPASSDCSPHENGLAAWKFLEKMMLGKLRITSSAAATGIPGIVYKKSATCQQVNKTFTKEYSAVYKPLKCSS
jgi:hypothetical protein